MGVNNNQKSLHLLGFRWLGVANNDEKQMVSFGFWCFEGRQLSKIIGFVEFLVAWGPAMIKNNRHACVCACVLGGAPQLVCGSIGYIIEL